MTEIIQTAQDEAQAKYEVLRECDITSLYIHPGTRAYNYNMNDLKDRTNMIFKDNKSAPYAIQKYVYVRSLYETFFNNFGIEPLIVYSKDQLRDPSTYTHVLLNLHIGIDMGTCFITSSGKPVSYRSIYKDISRTPVMNDPRGPNPFEKITFDLDDMPETQHIVNTYNLMAGNTQSKFAGWLSNESKPFDLATSQFTDIKELAKANFAFARSEILASMPHTYNVNDETLKQLFSVVLDNPENVEYEPEWEQQIFDHIK